MLAMVRRIMNTKIISYNIRLRPEEKSQDKIKIYSIWGGSHFLVLSGAVKLVKSSRTSYERAFLAPPSVSFLSINNVVVYLQSANSTILYTVHPFLFGCFVIYSLLSSFQLISLIHFAGWGKNNYDISKHF